jgi:hypothetical protein
MCVQVESRAVSLPPLWVISRMRPVESLTETEAFEGTAESAMIPFTFAVELLAEGGAPAELEVAELGAVDVVPVPGSALDPPELPQAASRATPPAPAPMSSCRRGQANVEGAAAELSDKTTSELGGQGN